MKTTIQYDRKVRAYRVLDAETGEVLSQHPQGPEGRYQAERAVIASDAPYTLLLADRIASLHPELAGRAHKAALLVANGHITNNGAVGAYYVASETQQPEVYRVETHAMTCSCEDWRAGFQGEAWGAPLVERRPHCKHLLAAMFCEQAGEVQ